MEKAMTNIIDATRFITVMVESGYAIDVIKFIPNTTMNINMIKIIGFFILLPPTRFKSLDFDFS